MDALLELWSREDPVWNAVDLRTLRLGAFARRTAPPSFSADQLVEASKRLTATMPWLEVTIATLREAIALEAEIGDRACTERRGDGRVLRIYAPDRGIDR